MIYSITNDPTQTALELNHDLTAISTWAYQWKMAFNPEPTKQAVELLFSHKLKPIQHPPIFFNGLEVMRVSEHKHLGLTLDSKLSFSAYINKKIKKARKSLRLMKHISAYIPLNTLDEIYKFSVRSHFDYCDSIYHIPPSCNPFDSSITLHPLMEAIERIQYQADLIITGSWKGTSRNKLYEDEWGRRLI